jgi:hypothetical protein
MEEIGPAKGRAIAGLGENDFAYTIFPDIL